MFIKSLQVKGMLSFEDVALDLRPLNVLIGPNASGKSNLIEIIALLQAAPRDLAGFIRESGGITDWLWKGDNYQNRIGRVEVILNVPNTTRPLRYLLEIGEQSQRFDILEEKLENEHIHAAGYTNPYRYFRIHEGKGVVRTYLNETQTRLIDTDNIIPPGQSVLHEIRNQTLHPEIYQVSRRFDAIRLYREWNMGRKSGIRKPQPTDAPNDFLLEDFSNVALVLNRLQSGHFIREIEENLQNFYHLYEQVNVGIQANTAQLWIREKGLENVIPATRLSDGTLRFLALLMILCHPDPPPLICIEEPELGLHPDVIPQIAELLKSASERTQLIVTTHSKALIDEFSDVPGSVVVCERTDEFGTEFNRLSRNELEIWLEDYQLGELWQKGEIGGTRW